jgi:DNA invertase Pin-like site-specific DNA recombinase
MTPDPQGKVQTRHRKRQAYLYIRQSSLRQVLENTESTERQYALKQRALALGWGREQLVVVDNDLGQSGASSEEREGFQRLVRDVGMGRAGIVMGLEVSRLARNNADWHRLLEICALTDTLILDEDGIYDPAHFNDRLLLGLKGTMSEAELHLLRARLIGGMMNKARRGELRCRLPMGFVYDGAERVILDPDSQVQGAVRLFFETFRRVGSATATVKAFREQQLRFPRRITHGPRKGEVIWGELAHHRALWLLHHPRYAGAFCYGRSRQRKHGELRYKRLPREEWIALVRDAHPGYITWDEFEGNLERLRQNAAAHGEERRRSPPREGPALLQGLVICAQCGNRMSVRYDHRNGKSVPYYTCQREGIEQAKPICQSVPGAGIDRAIGALVVEALTPLTVEVTLAIHQELQARFEQADQLRHKAVERAQYEADLARRRYMQVEPENRLVADSLEAEWNEKLRAVVEAQERYERQRAAERLLVDDEQRAQIMALADDFPALWNDPATPDRERKRMLRLLIEDVTLHKGNEIVTHVRFRGGTTQTIRLPRPLPIGELRRHSAKLVAAVDRLIDDHTDNAIAAILNARGMRSCDGGELHRLMIRNIRLAYGLKSRYERLREAGYLSAEEIAQRFDIAVSTVKHWRCKGWLQALAYDDKPHYLYAVPDDDAPVKFKWKSRRYAKPTPHQPDGVQYEA